MRDEQVKGVTLFQQKVMNRIKRDGISSNEYIDVWEDEQHVGQHFTLDSLVNSLRVSINDEEEDE